MKIIRPRSNVFISLLAVFIAVVTILPIVFVFIISFSSEESIVKRGYSFIPEEFSLEAYKYLMSSMDIIGKSFLLSIFIMIVGTTLSLWLISTMAFVISRRDFRLQKLYMLLIIIPMFFSGGLVASYVVNTQLLNLKNNVLALILPGACSSWYILVMRTYFKNQIPEELLDAARTDGATTFRLFMQIVLPLSKPIMVTVGIFEAFAYWNSWYYAMLYISQNHSELYPLQYVLYSIQKSVEFVSHNDRISGTVVRHTPTESFRMAIVVIITIPVLIAYPLLQKYLEKGIMAGGLKG
ncbi:carbohydrate ABC transporter permease [Butyrivibrio sp. AC2005]|uniref:carbohydrate ABC transporter permease n=1 Tax=Butyrivibrio sp. AC2005 TaxID=1280672 RepID=UPI000479526C|nr:carbohydrate ABC transporter permease [Butyrivibrio sp. AC2005]